MPQFRIATVGPELAREWLQKNVDNRPLSRVAVEGYKDSMRRGHWRLAGDAIMFNKRGELINGQHRLHAVAESGITVSFLVMEDCDVDVKAIIDLGRSRSVADMLRMIYGVDRAAMVTSVLAMLDRHVYSRHIKLTVDRALEQIELFDPALRWATRSVPGRNIFASAPIIGACVYAHKTHPDQIEQYAKQVFEGHDLVPESPILHLRRIITRAGGVSGRASDREDAFFLCLSALYKQLRGERVQLLRRLDSALLLAHFGRAYGERIRKGVAA